MPVVIRWTVEARAALLAGFRSGTDRDDVIRAAVLAAGTDVSVRTIERRRSKWRAECRLFELAGEHGLAIAACDVGGILAGDIVRLPAEQLAARIILIPDWHDQREKLLLAAVRAFLANPTPAKAFVAQQEIMLLLFEAQLARYHKARNG